MDTATSLTPNQDERVMAALAHVTVLLPMIGVISPIVIWVTQKDKSQYVAFQALQALAYQLTMIVAWFLGMGCYTCSFFINFLIMFLLESPGQSQTVDPVFGFTFLTPFIVFGVVLIGEIAFVIYGLVGAVTVFQGKPFRYVLIGDRVERFLQQK